MKKLLLVLALLLLTMNGAFAVTYPSCSKGGSVANGTNGDSFKTNGWCVDGYGVLTPETGMTTSSTQPNSQGGMAVPVIAVNTPIYTSASPLVLIPQQTGSYISDMGGVTADSLVGMGGHYRLPTAAAGLIYTFSVGSKSTITIDVVDAVDSIQMNANSGSGQVVGPTLNSQSIKNPGSPGDSITLWSPGAGKWLVGSMSGYVLGSTVDTVWVNNGSNT